MRDRPNPEMAPYRPAADVVKQNDRKKPIQLNRKATGGGGKQDYVDSKHSVLNSYLTSFAIKRLSSFEYLNVGSWVKS